MMNGGVAPGGICRTADCEMAVTWAVAASMLRARLEEDLDDRDARERLALDVLDVVDRGGEEALEVA